MKAIEYLDIGIKLEILFEETTEISKWYTSTIIDIDKEILFDKLFGEYIICTIKCDEDNDESIVYLYENDFEKMGSIDCWKFHDSCISKLIKGNITQIDSIIQKLETTHNPYYIYIGMFIALAINFYISK